MAFISFYKAKVPCKTMTRHGIGEFIRKGYHVRPCRDMAMASFKRNHVRPCQVMEMVSGSTGKFKENIKVR
ncbi:uvrabc system c [Gossypium arboreum]|uniref:Uvrabc system c n=1 Tax=Gossypium arboreum TaxID=29729 RepID=A0A0B0MLU5_GOSAR|nr:uvrabc system c [Gossypium arboreum]